jgi:hypothetical protein
MYNELKMSDLEGDGNYFMCSESSEEDDFELQSDIPRRKMKITYVLTPHGRMGGGGELSQ